MAGASAAKLKAVKLTRTMLKSRILFFIFCVFI
jgi:hypothetical protein